MDLKEKTVEELMERRDAIVAELDAPEADLDALEEETRAIKAELEERKAEEARKAEIRAEVAAGAGEVVTDFHEEVREERKMYGRETEEYRAAFIENLFGRATEEQRAILADNTNYGDGISLPVALDSQIWDQVNEAHPILADVATIRSGIAIKVTKVTPAAITKKMDKDASTEQGTTTAEVVLVGADYHTYVTVSYAEAKMSQGAVEQFLVKEIADAIGEALAKDVFARILSDATTAQKVTATSDLFEDLKGALALAKKANRPVIYAPSAQYYEIMGAIKSGSPYNMAAALGCTVKLDNAATGVTVVDPNLFVLNIIHDTMIESERDAKNAAFVIAGYMRAEGCLRKTQAAAYIA